MTGSFSSDADLVARIRAGDRAAFNHMVTQYAAELVQLAVVMLGDRDGAEDVAQEVLVRVWERRATWELRGALRPYLMRAVANHAQNVRQMRANHRRLEGVERDALQPTPLPADANAETERDALLWRRVHELPERWREAILLRYVQRLSFAEVGGLMQISEDAAKKLVRRAVEALRAVIQE